MIINMTILNHITRVTEITYRWRIIIQYREENDFKPIE